MGVHWPLAVTIIAAVLITTDGDELDLGPLDCGNGVVVENKCFRVHLVPKNYIEASRFCLAEKGQLAVVEPGKAELKLNAYLKENNIPKLLIGAKGSGDIHYRWGGRDMDPDHPANKKYIKKAFITKKKDKSKGKMGYATYRAAIALVVDEESNGVLWESVPQTEELPFVCLADVTDDPVKAYKRKRENDRKKAIYAKQMRNKEMDPIDINKGKDIPGLTGGDMIYDQEQHTRIKRNLGDTTYFTLWENWIVPYDIVDGYSATIEPYLVEPMQELEQMTGIKFVRAERDNLPSSYVNIFNGNGCYSHLGKMTTIINSLSLGEGCFGKGTIQHELMHTLGFFHEQSRGDRDNYIDIIEENIEEGKSSNFDKYEAFINTKGVAYDITSLMHYGAYSFSKNKEPTIEVSNPRYAYKEDDMGQREGLTPIDTYEIVSLYYNNDYKDPIDGGWSHWHYGVCSVTCGQGVRQKHRECNHPKPDHGGKMCVGNHTILEDCAMIECPANGEQYYKYVGCYSDNEDSDVSVISSLENSTSFTMANYYERPDGIIFTTCLEAAKSVGATYFAIGDLGKCLFQDEGEEYDFWGTSENCLSGRGAPDAIDVYTVDESARIQCQWSEWSEWELCSAHCGGGTQGRTRVCNNPRYIENDVYINCVGDAFEEKTCNSRICPIHAVWQDWGPWSDCSTTCGEGNQIRTRVCSAPEFGGWTCRGDTEETQTCYGRECGGDACNNNQCQNNAECITLPSSGYLCQCTNGFSGTNCEIDLNTCDGKCQNGGTCSEDIPTNTVSCTCPVGYTGDDCEVDINYCSPNDCVHGECIDGETDYTCQCLPGYEGDLCNINTNDCAGQPCNHGQCIDLVDHKTCVCNEGFDGEFCQINIVDCKESSCVNGQCEEIEDGPGFTCVCPYPYTGIYCETEVDYCADEPCGENGLCQPELGGFNCDCLPGWTGDVCSTDINECENLPCQNGATCNNKLAAYSCNCADGYTGLNCEQNIDDCAVQPCQNAGWCEDLVNAYNCVCADGFEGATCEINVDDCASAPCRNGGSCTDDVNDYRCTCVAGYVGWSCETDRDDCASSPCYNGGSCLDGVDSFMCTCSPGYTGDLCEDEINLCTAASCQNGGACQNHRTSFTCTCPLGFEGDICQNDVDSCLNDPCKNGGSCVDGTGSTYSCLCQAGFSGPNCDEDIDECLSYPCVNGFCVDKINSYVCDCVAGYEGINCEIDIDDCANNPCKNGGSCQDELDFYWCTCATGFTGDNCEIEIDHCDPYPCVNEGVCFNMADGYNCECMDGYEGTECETEINECDVDYVTCENGGTCVDDVARFTCQCDGTGYEGTYCENKISNCVAHQCQFGDCIDQEVGYRCQCQDGYRGTFCDEEIITQVCDETNCINGVCTTGTATCDCNIGYEGEMCDTRIDFCDMNPCDNNGQCSSDLLGPVCTCPLGFDGPFCELVVVDGGWSAWSEFTECSVTCGGGYREASRTCTNPAPEYGGQFCDGSSVQVSTCSEAICADLDGTYPEPDISYSFQPTMRSIFNPEGTGVKLEGDAIMGTKGTLSEYGDVITSTNISSLSTGQCLVDPDTCQTGMTVSLWVYQDRDQRLEAFANSPNVLFSSGVDPNEAVTPKMGLGVAVVVQGDEHEAHLVKIWLRTRDQDFTGDFPITYFEENTWTHIAFVYRTDHSPAMETYVQGRPISMDVAGSPSHFPNYTTVYDNIRFGGSLTCNSHKFLGSFAAFKYWERPLSRSDIYNVFASATAQCTMCDTNAICGPDTTCVCTSPFTSVDQFSCGVSSDPTVGVKPTVVPVFSSTMGDISPADYGKYANMPDVVQKAPGIYGDALYFNGFRDYMIAGDYAGQCLSYPDNCDIGLSVAFWVRYHGRGDRANVIVSSGGKMSASNNATDGTGLTMWQDNGQLYVVVQTTTTKYSVHTPGLTVNTWQHVTLVWGKAEGVTVYVNGEVKGQVTIGTDHPQATEEGTAFYVAKPNHCDVLNGRLDMDELALFDAPLTQDNVRYLMYNQGSSLVNDVQ